VTLLALSLGSNLQREKHIRFALSALRGLFARLEVSPVYETRAVGFEGPDFYNLVVVVDTSLDLDVVLDKLRQIEIDAGRRRDEKSFQSRNLDIDVLLFGGENLRDQGRNIPRSEIEHAAYVLKPLAQVLPKIRHPVSGRCFEDLWADFDTDQPAPRRIKFDLRDLDVN
jgi:2-amino-4-hydroxy-6-hydroxymethyldihydropteridine diphosphokinase